MKCTLPSEQLPLTVSLSTKDLLGSHHFPAKRLHGDTRPGIRCWNSTEEVQTKNLPTMQYKSLQAPPVIVNLLPESHQYQYHTRRRGALRYCTARATIARYELSVPCTDATLDRETPPCFGFNIPTPPPDQFPSPLPESHPRNSSRRSPLLRRLP
eukprot:3331827-Rhodomonas_salina.1